MWPDLTYSPEAGLLKDAVGRQTGHVARVADHHLQLGVFKEVAGIGKRLAAHIWYHYLLAVMRIDVKSVSHAEAYCHDHKRHGNEIAKEIAACEFAEEFEWLHTSSFLRFVSMQRYD